MKSSPFTKHSQLPRYWDHCPNCGERLLEPQSYSARDLLLVAAICAVMGLLCGLLMIAAS